MYKLILNLLLKHIIETYFKNLWKHIIKHIEALWEHIIKQYENIFIKTF